jgi:hypothetical protein
MDGGAMTRRYYKTQTYLCDARMDVEVEGYVEDREIVDVETVRQLCMDFEPFGNWLDFERLSQLDKDSIEVALTLGDASHAYEEADYNRDAYESAAQDRILEQEKGVKP